MMTTTTALQWDANVDTNGTSLRGYFEPLPYSFEETVARLITLSGQDPTANTDEYKVSVEFVGTFRGQVFTLYDYKGGMDLHIGGRALDVEGLKQALIAALATVEPTPYRAVIRYDEESGREHEWSAPVPATTATPLYSLSEDLLKSITKFQESNEKESLINIIAELCAMIEDLHRRVDALEGRQ